MEKKNQSRSRSENYLVSLREILTHPSKKPTLVSKMENPRFKRNTCTGVGSGCVGALAALSPEPYSDA